jgi:hypothetical protein
LLREAHSRHQHHKYDHATNHCRASRQNGQV